MIRLQIPLIFRPALLATILPAGMLNAGHVATDGTVGAATTLTGPNFSISASLGRQVGPNLFHSFSTFNLDQGETATFTASASTTAILARVTGGSVSNINGTIATRLDSSPTTPHPAAFYLINPAGVVFGPNAQLDVGGSFVVTTADTVRLADGGHFDASTPNTSLLTSAAPAAFGFIKTTPAPVTVNGSMLTVPAGQALSILGGSGTQVENAVLAVPNGRINIVGAGGIGSVNGDVGNPVVAPALDPLATPGDVLIGNSHVDVGGTSGGAIAIIAANLGITNSTLANTDTGAYGGAGIVIDASGDITAIGNNIAAISTGTATAGNLVVQGNNITVDNTAIATNTSAAAAGGDVTLNAGGTLSFVNGGHAGPSTTGPGNAGNLNVVAQHILIDAGTGGLATGLISFTNNSGSSGDVTIQANDLTLQNPDSSIFSLSAGGGNAGSVSIDVGSIAVNQQAVIATETFSGGNAGVLRINASTLSSNDGGFFAGVADATGQPIAATGAAGTLILNASTSLSLSNAKLRADTDLAANNVSSPTPGMIVLSSPSTNITGHTIISTATNAASAGGVINLSGADITISGSATVVGNTTGSGRAGDINVTASDRLTIQGDSTVGASDTGLFSSARAGSGAGGDISVTAGSISVTGPQCGIEANSFTSGNGGNITVNAQSITLDRQGATTSLVTGLSAQGQGSGNAGSISIMTGTLSVLGGAAVVANAFGTATGKGGSININASGSVVVDGNSGTFLSQITTSNTATGAGGGDVTLSAASVQVSNEGQILATTSGAAPAGNLRLSAGVLNIQGTSDTTSTGLFSNTIAAGAGGNIFVSAGSISVTGANAGISASSFAGGNGGDITISAQAIDLDRRGTTSSSVTGISAQAQGSGNAGTISVTTGALDVLGGSAISARAFGLATGKAGSININATGAVVVDGASGSSLSQITTTNAAAGAGGGNITIAAKSMEITNEGQIGATTFGAAPAGEIRVTANLLKLQSPSSPTDNSTGIFSNTSGGSGMGGDVNVTAGSLLVTGANCGISASSFSAGNGGSISVKADLIDLDREGLASSFQTGISAQAQGSGNAGTISVTTGTLDVFGGATVSAIALGAGATGKAGSINIDASRNIVVSGHAGSMRSSISSADDSPAGAGGGDLTISARSVGLYRYGALSAVSISPAPAGNILLNASRNIALARNGAISIQAQAQGGNIDLLSRAGELSLRTGALVTAEAGAGGNISLDAAHLIEVIDSTVSARAQHTGGQITIGPSAAGTGPAMFGSEPLPRGIILNRSTINGLVADGGKDLPVRIRALQFVDSSDSRILSNATLAPPEYDIAGSLVPLTGSLALPGARLVPQCGQLIDSPNLSSFIVTGFGGAPPEPGGWISGEIIHRRQEIPR